MTPHWFNMKGAFWAQRKVECRRPARGLRGVQQQIDIVVPVRQPAGRTIAGFPPGNSSRRSLLHHASTAAGCGHDRPISGSCKGVCRSSSFASASGAAAVKRSASRSAPVTIVNAQPASRAKSLRDIAPIIHCTVAGSPWWASTIKPCRAGILSINWRMPSWDSGSAWPICRAAASARRIAMLFVQPLLSAAISFQCSDACHKSDKRLLSLSQQ